MILSLSPPDVSEANLYDALIFAIGRMRRVPERKAIVVISSGVDTFSKATYEDVLTAARKSDAPLYAVSLGQVLQESTKLHGLAPGGIDWNQCTKRLAEIARSSGGRIYSPDIVTDLSSVYDDLLENLKVRYVVTYQSSGSDNPAPRTVRIALVDPATGKPLRIVDADGHEVRTHVVAEQTYTPPPATGVR